MADPFANLGRPENAPAPQMGQAAAAAPQNNSNALFGNNSAAANAASRRISAAASRPAPRRAAAPQNNSNALFGDDPAAANAAARRISAAAERPSSAAAVAPSGQGDRPPPVTNRQKNTGIGVLIDTEHLVSGDAQKAANPYYVVYKGRRFYGSSPEDTVISLKEQVASNPNSSAPKTPGVVSSMFSSAKGKYKNWQTRRNNKKAKAAANRAKCPFQQGERVIVKIPPTSLNGMDQEMQAANGKTATVVNYVPGEGGAKCTQVLVKFKDGKTLSFGPESLAIYGLSARFSKGVGKASRGFGAAASATRSAASRAATGIGSAASRARTGLSSAASRTRTGLSSAASRAGTGLRSAASRARTGLTSARNSMKQRYQNFKTRRAQSRGAVAPAPAPANNNLGNNPLSAIQTD